MPTISFLILTFNSSSHIKTLFNSLTSSLSNNIKEDSYEIIILDNASTDGSFQQTKEYFGNSSHKNVKILKSDTNLGYAKGINKMAREAKGEYLVVINPDSKVKEFDFEHIKQEFETNRKMGIAGFAMISQSGQKEKSCGKFFNPFSFFLFTIGLENTVGLRFAPEKKQKVDFLSGGFITFRKSVFEKLHGYDEDYFMYIEDMDICKRAKDLGYDTYFLPYAKIEHYGQGSSNREFAIVNIYKNIQLFFEKHAGALLVWYIKDLLAIKAMLIIFIATVFGKQELANTYMKAFKTI